MKVYALRHKATGAFMPARMFRNAGRGWSHWSPGVEGAEAPYDASPRLFSTRKGAENSRVLWAAGVWERNVGTTYSYYDGPEDYDETVPTAPPAPRHKDDLEVVAYELVEVQP